MPPDGTTILHRDLLIALAARHKLPAVYAFDFFVAAGGLMSYGTDQDDNFRLAASYVDRILRGDKPADLPVQAPSKFGGLTSQMASRRSDPLRHSINAVTRLWRRQCPLWVKSRHRGISNQCPLYPQKQTLELIRVMSALCQKRTHAPQQKSSIRSARRHAVGRIPELSARLPWQSLD